MEDKGITFREALRKSMGAVGSTMDIISNSATAVNDLVDAGAIWSKGVARAARNRDADMQLLEQTASLERRFDAAKRWDKAEAGMAKLKIEVKDGKFVRTK